MSGKPRPGEGQPIEYPEMNSGFNFGQSFKDYYYQNSPDRLADLGDGASDNAFTRWLAPEIAEQKQFAREMYSMDKQNAFNEYMWNMSNEYNSPEAQMERAKAAGINPLLAAQGIMGGGNATATPMQSAQGSSGAMNPHNVNPIDLMNTLFTGLNQGATGLNTLGKVLGFGKENKATINNINKATDKMGSELNLNEHQLERWEKTFDYFVDQCKFDAKQSEQNWKNLERTWDLIDEQVRTQKQITDLTEEQKNTQEYITKQEEYKALEEKFRNDFRECFGVNLNNSDMSMLIQAIMGGKGKAIFDELGNFVGDVLSGLSNKGTNVGEWVRNNEAGHKFIQMGKTPQDKRKRRWLAAKAERKWWVTSKQEKKRWNNNKEDFIFYWASKWYNAE